MTDGDNGISDRTLSVGATEELTYQTRLHSEVGSAGNISTLFIAVTTRKDAVETATVDYRRGVRHRSSVAATEEFLDGVVAGVDGQMNLLTVLRFVVGLRTAAEHFRDGIGGSSGSSAGKYGRIGSGMCRLVDIHIYIALGRAFITVAAIDGTCDGDVSAVGSVAIVLTDIDDGIAADKSSAASAVHIFYSTSQEVELGSAHLTSHAVVLAAGSFAPGSLASTIDGVDIAADNIDLGFAAHTSEFSAAITGLLKGIGTLHDIDLGVGADGIVFVYENRFSVAICRVGAGQTSATADGIATIVERFIVLTTGVAIHIHHTAGVLYRESYILSHRCQGAAAIDIAVDSATVDIHACAACHRTRCGIVLVLIIGILISTLGRPTVLP